jgi:ATP/ADP translocase
MLELGNQVAAAMTTSSSMFSTTPAIASAAATAVSTVVASSGGVVGGPLSVSSGLQPLLTTLPALRSALAVGRGGAAVHALAAASTAAAAAAVGARSVSGKKQAVTQEKILGIIKASPTGTSVFYMALAMAFHYFGYSLARPITVALFTSASTGYAGFTAAFPFAMAFVSPTALLLLVGYGNLLNKHGPQGALTRSTLLCAIVVGLSAAAIAASTAFNLHVTGIPAVKLVTGPLFVFRESYVQLLTSQYWSFMASVLDPSESARWFGPIAGLTSIASAVAGVFVAPMVEKLGLAGSLAGTAGTLLLSLLGTRAAYGIANRHGFAPKEGPKKKVIIKKPPPGSKNAQPGGVNAGGESIWTKASQLFRRVPVLKALFLEILASQGLATVLNVCFVAALAEAIPEDNERAGWVGVFFSVINVVTMVLQFLILPPLMGMIEPKALWRALPLVSLGFTAFQAGQKSPSLNLVSASLLVMKVSEYSARRLLDEMVFVPLDFESRFVGKEVIGVFGYRFGKSLMSLGLSGLTQLAGEFGLQQLSILSTVVALAWLRTAWQLSNLVPTHQEAQDVYNKEHKIKPAKKSAPPKKAPPRPAVAKKPAPRPFSKKK